MTTAKENAVKLIAEIVASASRKSARLLSLLKEPDSYSSGWAYVVSPSFNEALDIKLTDRVSDGGKGKVWTQGGNFNFKPGDIVHAADGKLALQVTESSSATQTDEYSVDGFVRYDVYEIDGGKYAKISAEQCSQIAFVRKLIEG
ncbi:MAG: hypothetical protein RLZZ322_96 [Verrucomicrobiota bacterium]|jgi:hypothetical protein